MIFRNPLIVFTIILITGFAFVLSYQTFGVLGIILLGLLILLLGLAVAISFRFRSVLIDEMEVGVIFNRINNSFSRFVVGPEPSPSIKIHKQSVTWIPLGRRILAINDPHFVRLQWFEELRGTITKKGQSVSGTLDNIRTAEGDAISIYWKVAYIIDVTLIPESLMHRMARVLPEHSGEVVARRVERAIKHLVEARTLQSLFKENAIQELERELSQHVNRQLSEPINLGFRNIPPKDVSLGPITSNNEKTGKVSKIANQVQNEFEMNQKSRGGIQSEVSHNLLVYLRQVLTDRFSPGDLQTLCFDLNITYENLAGDEHRLKALNLIQILQRTNRINELVEFGKQIRPDVPWELRA